MGGNQQQTNSGARGRTSHTGASGAEAGQQREPDAQDQYGNAFQAERLRDAQGGDDGASGPASRIEDRSLREGFTVTEDYDGFRQQVEAWLARQVMSRTEVAQPEGGTAPVRREQGLVEESNLAELHARLAAYAGDRVTLEAHLVAGAHRYEQVVFATPGLVLLDPIDIEGETVDRQEVVERIRRLVEERRVQKDEVRERVRRAHTLCQSAVMDGSTRYEPDEMVRRYGEAMRALEIFANLNPVTGGRDDTTAVADYNMRRFAIREGEAMAEAAIAEADAAVEEIERMDRELTELHEQIGETYVPSGNPQVPAMRR